MSKDIINLTDDALKNDYIYHNVKNNNENQCQSSENIEQFSNGLNEDNLNIKIKKDFGNEINNLEDLLTNLKAYNMINGMFKNNESIEEEEKEDINLGNFIFEFNKILEKIIKTRKKSNKLYEIQKKKENEILKLEKRKKELEEFNKNIETYKNEYDKKIRQFENNQKRFEIDKTELENYLKDYNQKKSDLKMEKDKFEIEKLELKKEIENERLKFEKEKENFEKEKLAFKKEKQNLYSKERIINEESNNKKNIDKYKYPKGLLNLGLSCYMNSLLQCLYYIPELRDYFIENKNNYDDKRPVCKALAEVMYGLKYDEKDYFEAKEFKKIMGDKNKLFSGKKAGDSKDLFFNLIDSLLTELNEEKSVDEENEKKIDLSNKSDLFKELENGGNNDNIINRLFIGYYITAYYCPTNQNSLTYSLQNESFILFELEKIKNYYNSNELSIEKCFNYYHRCQENTSFYCNTCNKIEVGNCREKIFRPPKILVIILDRGHGKIFKGKIKICNYLDLKFCIDDDNYKDSKLYKLICISTHTGSSSPNGH